MYTVHIYSDEMVPHLPLFLTEWAAQIRGIRGRLPSQEVPFRLRSDGNLVRVLAPLFDRKEGAGTYALDGLAPGNYLVRWLRVGIWRAGVLRVKR
jgi:hypothetical protein